MSTYHQRNATEQEQLRLDVAAYGRADLFFFAKAVCGFSKLTEGLHYDVCQELCKPDRFKLIELPRGHYKTTVCTIAYALWRAVQTPGIRILLRSATSDNASKWIVALQGIILSPMFKWLYPELIPKDFQSVRWNKIQIELERPQRWPEATIEAIGGSATAVSNHYDLQIYDDMVNEDHLINPEQMKKVIDEYRRSDSLFVSVGKGERLVVGNRWAFDDLNSWIRDNQPWITPYSRAAMEHGEPIFPEEFSKAVLDQILETQGPHYFSCLYMNNPIAENAQAFDPALWRYFDSFPTQPLRYYTACDYADSHTKTSDYTAIVTVGMDHEHTIYVVDARQGRWATDEFIDQIFEVVRGFKPIRIGIEANATEIIQHTLREAMRRERLTFSIEKLKHGNLPKYSKMRIGCLHEYFNNGSLRLRRHHQALLAQLKKFPGTMAHDDLADALAYAVQLARPASLVKTTDNNPLLLDNILLDLQAMRQQGRDVWTWHKKPEPFHGWTKKEAMV